MVSIDSAIERFGLKAFAWREIRDISERLFGERPSKPFLRAEKNRLVASTPCSPMKSVQGETATPSPSFNFSSACISSGSVMFSVRS
jgi:hypothetical protein